MTNLIASASPVHADFADVLAWVNDSPDNEVRSYPGPGWAIAPGFVPAFEVRISAERLRDSIDLAAGVISSDRFDVLEMGRINTLLALAASPCDDPDDLDPWDWPSDDREYDSADQWPAWTDCPIPYVLPADLAALHGDDHDAQPGDPGAIELGSVPSAEWYDWEAMFGDEPDPDTQAEWDRKHRSRQSA